MEQEIFDLNEWVNHMIKMVELNDKMAMLIRYLEDNRIDWK
jgi:hypothetical protein